VWLIEKNVCLSKQLGLVAECAVSAIGMLCDLGEWAQERVYKEIINPVSKVKQRKVSISVLVT
jgi:hypothetical protein